MADTSTHRDRNGRFAPTPAAEAPVTLTPAPGGEHFVIANGNRVDVLDGDVEAALASATARPAGPQPDRGRDFARSYR